MACGAVDRGLDIQMPGRHCHRSVQALEGLLQVRGSERIVAVGSQADMGERIVRIAPAALQHCLPGQPADEQPYQDQAARQEQEQITQGLQPGAVGRAAASAPLSPVAAGVECPRTEATGAACSRTTVRVAAAVVRRCRRSSLRLLFPIHADPAPDPRASERSAHRTVAAPPRNGTAGARSDARGRHSVAVGGPGH